MFFPNSRYATTGTYTVVRPDGTPIEVARPPLPAPGRLTGFHRRQEGQRLDLIAFHYLKDPTTFWRLCDANNSIVPDSLATAELVGVPEQR